MDKYPPSDEIHIPVRQEINKINKQNAWEATLSQVWRRGGLTNVKLGELNFNRMAREGLAGKVTVTVWIIGNTLPRQPHRWYRQPNSTSPANGFLTDRTQAKSLKYVWAGTCLLVCLPCPREHSLVATVPLPWAPDEMPGSRSTVGRRAYQAQPSSASPASL